MRESTAWGRDGGGRRVVAVTGASAGLGREMARRLGGLGWAIGLGARRTDRLAEAAEEVIEAGGEAFSHALDVTDPRSVESFFGAVEGALGPVDAVINNAAVGWPGAIHATSAERIETTIKTNLLGPLYVSRRATKSMVERGAGGDVVFISSEAASQPWPHLLPYGCSKAALEYLSTGLDAELEGTGIRVSTVRIGPSVSEWNLNWTEEEGRAALEVWQEFGLMRNFDYLEPATVADAVVMALTAPKGTKVNVLCVRPEVPPPDAAYTGATFDQGRNRQS
ncbi:MAG: SDR family oxidoreductase [Acidimicrobiales bacterium]